MGIDYTVAEPLIRLSPAEHGRKSVLSLGRLNVNLRQRQYRSIDALLKEHGHGFGIESALQEDGFSEKLFGSLGYNKVESLDVNDYENATHIADLGRDMGNKLRGKFDLIVDGGTTEHVFDIATCFRNVDRMLSKNGVFLSIVPLNDWAEHGFFQFGPEVVYGYWQNTMNYTVLHCEAVSLRKPWKKKPLPDHTGLRKRVALAHGNLPEGRCVLAYSVQKGKSPKDQVSPMQSFYEKTWTRVKARNAAAQL